MKLLSQLRSLGWRSIIRRAEVCLLVVFCLVLAVLGLFTDWVVFWCGVVGLLLLMDLCRGYGKREMRRWGMSRNAMGPALPLRPYREPRS